MKISIGTSTDVSKNPDSHKECNTSPLALIDLVKPSFMTTHSVPDELKTSIKIIPRPTTQIGCVPAVVNKDKKVQTDVTTKTPTTDSHMQTDNEPCSSCQYQEHLILKRLNYIIKDAELNTNPDHVALLPPEKTGERCQFLDLPNINIG